MPKLTNNRPKQHGDNHYSNKQIIRRLREHMIKNKKSLYSITKPTRNTILDRVKKDEELRIALEEIEAEHFGLFEARLLESVFEGVPLDSVAFNIATRNKKAFLSHEVLVLDEKVEALEKALVKSKK